MAAIRGARREALGEEAWGRETEAVARASLRVVGAGGPRRATFEELCPGYALDGP
jgi:hypothetical protein